MTSLESLKISSNLFVDDNKYMRYYEYLFNIVDNEYKKLDELGFLDRLILLQSNMVYEYIVDKDSILYSNGIYQINIEFTSVSNDFTLSSNIDNVYIFGECKVKYKIYSIVGNYGGLKLFNTQLLGSFYIVNDISGFVGNKIKLYHSDNIIYNTSLDSLKIRTIQTDYVSQELTDININRCSKIYYSYSISNSEPQVELCNNLCDFYKYNLKNDGIIILSLNYNSKIELNKYVNSLNVKLMDANLDSAGVYILGNTLNITIRKNNIKRG